MSNEYAEIGEIKFSPYNVSVPNLGVCNIYVQAEVYTVPHFHLTSTDGKTDITICLLEAKYFEHGGFNKKILSEEQLSMLMAKLINKNPGDLSLWESMLYAWNKVNTSRIPVKLIRGLVKNNMIPNYLEMDSFIYETPEGHIDSLKVNKGTIDFSKIENRSYDLEIKEIGRCRISVSSDEYTDVPHFDIVSDNSSQKTERIVCSVCIYSADYYYKNNYPNRYGKLSSKQKAELNSWLASKSDYLLGDITNWQNIVNVWESLNRNVSSFDQSLKTKIQPDYTKLEEL